MREPRPGEGTDGQLWAAPEEWLPETQGNRGLETGSCLPWAWREPRSLSFCQGYHHLGTRAVGRMAELGHSILFTSGKRPLPISSVGFPGMGDAPKRPRPLGMDGLGNWIRRREGRALPQLHAASAAWLLLVISFLRVSVSLSIKWGDKGSPGGVAKRIT